MKPNGNGHQKKKPKLEPMRYAWENCLIELVGKGITNGISEEHMIAALERSKLGLIMAHTVATVERRATKKN